MKNEIITNLNDPGKLEELYRNSKLSFKRDFNTIYPELKGNILADSWNVRLNYESDEINRGTGRELLFVIIASLVAGFIAKIPGIFQINEEFFYPRNIGFIFLPILTMYFAWKNELQIKRIALTGSAVIIAVIYINLLPASDTSDTLILACIHLPLLLWGLLGSAFAGNNLADSSPRLDFLKYNGDLVVMTTLIMIAGGIMTGLTIGLFELIGFNIHVFYFNYIVIVGLAAAPIFGTYLIRTNPHLVGKVSPVIARIFSQLVLIMLVIYLTAIIYSGKDPYNDREFLLIFNLLLIGVMAIIFFSVAETSKNTKHNSELWVLLLLSVITIAVNGIALSAILFRISEWGITPNRLAVLGANILILINLLLVSVQLFRVLLLKYKISTVGNVIALYLPVYFIWTIIVVFMFPLLFGFK
jgi:hypothetical protein